MKRFTILIPILLSATNLATAQLRNQDCMSEVRQVFHAMTDLGMGSDVIHVGYSMVTRSLHNGRTVSQSTQMELTGNRERLHLVSDQIATYQDATASVTVIPSRRTIYLRDPDPQTLKGQRMEGLSSIRDTLLGYCRVEECRAVKVGGADRRVVLSVDPVAQSACRVATLTMLLNSTSHRLRQISVEYIAGSTVESVEVTFERVEEGYRSAEFEVPIMSLFFDRHGNLLKKYAGYRVVDSRVRK